MVPTTRVSSDPQQQINNSSDDHAIIYINNGFILALVFFYAAERNGGRPLGFSPLGLISESILLSYFGEISEYPATNLRPRESQKCLLCYASLYERF